MSPARGLPKIRARLTLWYAGTMIVLLLAFTAVLHVAVTRAVERNFDASVEESLQLVRTFFRTEIGEYHAVETTARHVGAELVFPSRRVEFTRPDGSVLSTPGLGAPPRLEPPVRTVEIPLDPALAPGWRIHLHASMADAQRMLARVDRWFAISIPLTALLSLLAGWLVAGRTLAPVGTMAAATERIIPGDPATRLPIADPADELGRLGTRFNALLDRLDQALAQQRRFLADAEHELRTPVTRMRSRVDLALLTAAAGPDREALIDVERELRRASQLLGELLLLARADAEPYTGQLARGFLDDVALTALRSWRAPAATAGVTLVASVMSETPARLDATLMERLIGTLLDNAIRYTPRGGTVDLRVFPADGRAVLEVHDSGVGIPPADRERVFERFYRGADARRLQPEGSGLGLSIARWIAERHEGRLILAPREGGGTVARVELPLA